MGKELDIRRQITREWAEYVRQVREQSHGKRIFVYGAGRYGRKLVNLLLQQGIKVAGYVVTQAKYNQTQVNELPICTLKELVIEKASILFLIGVNEAFQMDIVRTLQADSVVNYLEPPIHFSEMMDDCFNRPVMEITPKAGCSVHCKYCPQDTFLKRFFSQKRQSEMTLDDFKVYLNKMPQDLVVDFSGFVEPFLARDGLRMVQYAHESGHEVRLFTTLMGLDMPSFQVIEDIPFKLVVLHLPDVHHYANIPVTEEYLELLRYVVAKKRPNGEPFVDIANCQSNPDPRVVEIIGHRFPISWDMVDRAGTLSDEHLRSAERMAEPIYCSRTPRLNHNVLLPNGDVVLCCMDFGMQRVLGNLKQQSYEEIMQGDPLARIVGANARQGDLLCRQCTFAKRVTPLLMG